VKKYTLAFLVFLLLAAGCSKSAPVVVVPTQIPPVQTPLDYKNISYTVEGKTITLVNGQAETQMQAGSASKVTTKIFEANTQGDLNGDGLPDIAVTLTQDSGGSGIFYYIAAAIKTAEGYTGTNAVLLGDRVAPQDNRIQNNLLTVNYADRKLHEDFSVQPSVGKSLYLEYFNGTLVAQPEALQVSEPLPYQSAASPLTIKGQARGTWFFEASFPVVLKDARGKIIAQGTAQTKANWMTENFVPFVISLAFVNQPNKSVGSLILKKGNPSGLLQNDVSYELPVIFKSK
jgi:hypothetical protein